jgi:hypothetical protein
MVPVLVSELPEDREKELIIKDNLAYGTFDMELLNEQYSREELLLYDVINDEMKQLTQAWFCHPESPEETQRGRCPEIWRYFCGYDQRRL